MRPATEASSLLPDVSQPESLILPDGSAEPSVEFVRPRVCEEEGALAGGGNSESEDEDGIEEGSVHESESHVERPWWRTPSPLWLLIMLPFTAIAMAATVAPRIEIYTILACNVHKPGYTNLDNGHEFGISRSQHVTLHLLISSFGLEYSVNEPALGGTKTPAPNMCAVDPVVQAAVAKLTTVMTASMGVLSCLTTAWWGAFSDRYGRTSVMGISVIGLLLTDVNFILVSMFADHLPGNYWFLLVGPLVEGCLGGFTSAAAAMHAYMADCTDPTSRSRTFSLSLGLLFTGIAVGPTVGGLLIRYTHSVISVFYLATFIHLLYAIVVWVVLPESLSVSKRRTSRRKYVDFTHRAGRGLMGWVKSALGFLSPLDVFSPVTESRANRLKCTERDWSLSLLAAAYGFTIMIMGSYTYKFQYAAATFGWTSEFIGYYLSLVGATRAIYLTIVLPALLKLFKPKPVAIELPVRPSEPLHTGISTVASESANATRVQIPPLPSLPPNVAAFDLALARISLIVEVIAYTAMGLAPAPLEFTIFTIFGSLGTGFSPAVQSVALELYSRRGGTESGRLFGALSVVQALCSQILGPAVYGFTYMKTVASFPRTIFFVSVASVATSFVLLSLVRLPKGHHDTDTDDMEGHTPSEGSSVDITA